MRESYISLGVSDKPVVNIVLRRKQEGPVKRICQSIFNWIDDIFPFSLVRNAIPEEMKHLDHFLSFAEIPRYVSRGYMTDSPCPKIVNLYHLDKRRKHVSYSKYFDACNYICVQSNEWRDHLIEVEEVDPSKIRVIYTGVVSATVNFDETPKIKPFIPLSDVRRKNLRKEFSIPEDVFVVGHLGRDQELRKDCSTLYKALDVMGKKVFPIFFEDSGYNAGAKKLGNEGFSRFRDIYNLMDLYVVSSIIEGGPLGFIEATACGVPVISTRVGMALDLNSRDLFFDFGSVKQLVDRITYVIDNKKTVKENTVQLRSSLSWLDWEWSAKQYYKMYRDSLMSFGFI